MKKRTEINYRYREDGLHFTASDEEFLSLRYSGEVVIRSRASDGSRHIHITSWPGLLPWIISQLCEGKEDFFVGVYPLPKVAHRRIRIRSVITLFVVEPQQFPLVLTREPLDERDVDELIRVLPPPLALLNAGQVYYNSRAPHACPRLV